MGRLANKNILIIGGILFVLVPGYAPMWSGILGPVLWIAGFACTAVAQVPVSDTVARKAGDTKDGVVK
jgi:hypothetical protein